ncbi:MAG: peptidase S41 [Flavobacteriales bacterium]|nr:peptidase S41 [Flavobacteriales bacterium]|tara:strand:+ start:1072 stop:2715 length:1644 start_codon:yes stop_codon:yes gene_type:complete
MKKKLKIVLLTIVMSSFAIFSTGISESYFEIAKNLDIFNSLYKELNSLYVDDTDPGELMKESIDHMLESLDPYTTYIPESEIEDFRFMTTGQYGGIGAVITKRDEHVYISEPYEGFAAQKSGLMAGDKILEINGTSAKNKSTEEVSKILKGQPGTSVSLLIERKSVADPFTVIFDREKVTINSVSYSDYINDDIGYVKLRSFTRGCAEQLKKSIVELNNKKVLKGLILDLRSNPGGLLNESVDIANLFIDKGEIIVSTKGKINSWDKEYIAKKTPMFKNLPLVVLINNTSASASEIVSGSIQDLDRGVIIGKKSFGKGLVQQTRKLPYNSELKLTVAKYYIPSGRCIQAIDYSNRNEDGSVGVVADSLLTEFRTRNGRKVYDGGGITPDIITNEDFPVNLIKSLVKERLFFDFATDFRIKNDQVNYDFVLTEEGFSDFIYFLSDKKYEYKTKTESAIESLKEKSKTENYFSEIEEELNLLLSKYYDSKKDDLNKNKQIIKEILTGEIMSRYYYQKGRIKASLNFDEDVKKAIEILEDGNEYNALLNI